MTPAFLSQHLNHRRAKAESFIKEPEKFKVCTQCRSIAPAKARICPVFHCYRWDGSAAGVKRTAAIIAENPFPLTAGVVPRLVGSN